MAVEVLALVLGSLVWGPLVALSKLSPPEFSTVEQCGAVSVSFSGSLAPSAFPLTLTMLPFDSVPFTIVLRESCLSTSASGSHKATVFLPFAVDTSFVATVQTSSGDLLTSVSNILTVQPSSNLSCVRGPSSARLYTLVTPLAQCEAFTISFNSTLVQTPTVRALIPGEEVLTPVLTSQDIGWASYILNATSGSRVLFDLNDGKGHRESTALLSVGGDLSFNGCLSSAPARPAGTNGSSRLPRPAVIAIATLTTVTVFLVIISVIFYRLRQRRERRWTVLNEKTKKWSPPLPPEAPWDVVGRTNPRPNPAPTPEPTRDSLLVVPSDIPNDSEILGQGGKVPEGSQKQVRWQTLPRTADSSTSSDGQDTVDSVTFDEILETTRLYNAAFQLQSAPQAPTVVVQEASPPFLGRRFLPKRPDAPESVSSRPTTFSPSRPNSFQPVQPHFSASTQSAYSIPPISTPRQASTITVRPSVPPTTSRSLLQLVISRRETSRQRPDTTVTTDSLVYYQGIAR